MASTIIYLDDTYESLSTFVDKAGAGDGPSMGQKTSGVWEIKHQSLPGTSLLLYGNFDQATQTGDIKGFEITYGGPNLVSANFDTTLKLEEFLAALNQSAEDAVTFLLGGNDTITGSKGADRIDGLGGNDELHGGDGSDILFGGKGDDLAYGGAGDDQVYGADGDDLTIFNAGDGGALYEVVQGHAGTDTVRFDGSVTVPYFFMSGVERLAFGAAATVTLSQFLYNDVDNLTVVGSADQNTLSFKLVNKMYYEEPVPELLDASAYTFLSWGPEDRFLVTGTAGADTIRGPQVAAILDGDAGDDVIRGGAGADRLVGGAGFDTLVGGKGNDTYVIDGADEVYENASGGIDTILVAGSFSLSDFTQFENLGMANAAGVTSAKLTGNGLANTLTGDAGSNVLAGGLGKDTLDGGKGKDFFVFNTKLSKSNIDKIQSYSVKDDTVRLENKVFKGLKAGKLSKDAFVIGKAAQDSEDRVIYDKGSGKLYFDLDGAGGQAQVQFATLSKNLKLAAADFVVI